MKYNKILNASKYLIIVTFYLISLFIIITCTSFTATIHFFFSIQADTSNKPSSLAFNFLPTIPATIKYVKTVQDSTMGGGRRTTINEIKILYATYEPNKNVRCALEEFQGNEVVLLRKLLIKHGLGSCRREVSNK